ncbi:hypothetical protein [Kitasatospora sp. NPDC054795]
MAVGTDNGPAVTVAARAVARIPDGAVARRDGGGEAESQWIFDRTVCAFLGERTVALTDAATVRKGDTTGRMAVLARAVVDAAGTRP